VNEPFRRDVMIRVSGQGPLPASEIPDTAVVPWSSSGWTTDRNVMILLECLMMRGDLAVAGRRNGERLWDLAELFDFEYVLEMYKPRDQRRWGYWAMPILHGDRLVGKADATADRTNGVLRVDAIHEDEPFTGDLVEAVFGELDSLAGWLGLEIGGRAVGLPSAE
jgi:uncharacterized protein YcaQ